MKTLMNVWQNMESLKLTEISIFLELVYFNGIDRNYNFQKILVITRKSINTSEANSAYNEYLYAIEMFYFLGNAN